MSWSKELRISYQKLHSSKWVGDIPIISHVKQIATEQSECHWCQISFLVSHIILISDCAINNETGDCYLNEENLGAFVKVILNMFIKIMFLPYVSDQAQKCDAINAIFNIEIFRLQIINRLLISILHLNLCSLCYNFYSLFHWFSHLFMIHIFFIVALLTIVILTTLVFVLILNVCRS